MLCAVCSVLCADISFNAPIKILTCVYHASSCIYDSPRVRATTATTTTTTTWQSGVSLCSPHSTWEPTDQSLDIPVRYVRGKDIACSAVWDCGASSSGVGGGGNASNSSSACNAATSEASSCWLRIRACVIYFNRINIRAQTNIRVQTNRLTHKHMNTQAIPGFTTADEVLTNVIDDVIH